MRGPRVETVQAASNVATAHGVDDYPGLTVVAVPGWTMRVIVPQPGQTIVARGGEHVPAYTLRDGARAAPFRLALGDRATCLRDDLPHSLAEWRIERSA
jgi:hypothetical protein